MLWIIKKLLGFRSPAEEVIYPEDYRNAVRGKKMTKRARQLRMALDFAKTRELIKTNRELDSEKVTASNRRDRRSKAPRKGSKKMTWPQFVENSRKVAESFTDAYRIRQNNKDEFQNRSNKLDQ